MIVIDFVIVTVIEFVIVTDFVIEFVIVIDLVIAIAIAIVIVLDFDFDYVVALPIRRLPAARSSLLGGRVRKETPTQSSRGSVRGTEVLTFPLGRAGALAGK